MDVLQPVLPTLFIVAACQGLFLTLLLFRSKTGDHSANRFLCGLTLLFSLTLLDYSADLSGFTEQWPFITTLLWPKELIFGPLIFLYCIELTRHSTNQLTGYEKLHFLPGLIHIGLTWPLLFLPQPRQKQILDGSTATLPEFSELERAASWVLGDFETVISLLSIALYLGLSIRHLSKYSVSILNSHSDIEHINLNWLKRLLGFLLVIYLLFAVTTTLLNSWMEHLIGMAIVILIYMMGYRGLQQPEIFRAIHPSSTFVQEADGEQTDTNEEIRGVSANVYSLEKYEKSALDAYMSAQLMVEIRDTVEQRKLFLEPQLTLDELSEALSMPPHYVSQAINEQTGHHFFDFINAYRVEAAKQWLLDNGCSLTIVQIAMESGFNSKSAFYASFKKHTGSTPTQFRKEHQQIPA